MPRSRYDWSTTGQIVFFEFDSHGRQMASGGLTNASGTPFTLASGSKVIGTDRDFLDRGGSDLFVRGTDGKLYAYEFDPNTGRLLQGGGLLNANGSALVIESGALVVGTAENFLHANGTDVFVQRPNGAFSVYEFDRPVEADRKADIDERHAQTSNRQSMPKERRVTNRSAASPNSSAPR